jgi:O-acetyl-ADP-ribose deacetylase (regulator of RNase III)
MTSIRAVQGDITGLSVDAIVNAANEALRHGGGVALAIARAGAPEVDRDSDRWIAEHGPLGPGDAAVTSAGSMPARMVVHVVGPRHRPGQDNEGLLSQAVRAALDGASSRGARSVAMPAISAGIFGYPRPEATSVIARTCRTWADEHPDDLDEILLVGYDAGTTDDFEQALALLRNEGER